jgi:hypothetical protein
MTSRAIKDNGVPAPGLASGQVVVRLDSILLTLLMFMY